MKEITYKEIITQKLNPLFAKQYKDPFELQLETASMHILIGELIDLALNRPKKKRNRRFSFFPSSEEEEITLQLSEAALRGLELLHKISWVTTVQIMYEMKGRFGKSDKDFDCWFKHPLTEMDQIHTKRKQDV